MEATESKKSNDIAPNINLDISACNQQEDYYLAIEIKRIPFDGILRPLNMIQGIIWDDIIYNFVLKTSESMRTAWKTMPKENKKALHHRFAVKYGTEKELNDFREEIFVIDIGKKLKENTASIIRKALRQIPTGKRKKIREIDEGKLSSFDKFMFTLSQFGIIFLMPIEKDE